MYIKRLEKFNTRDWDVFLSIYNIKDIKEKILCETILTSLNKSYIEDNIDILKKVWIVNGVWPWYLPSFIRTIITSLFKNVRYELHDIEYSIPWTKQDRYRADKGLLKYSLQWLSKQLTILIPIKILIVVICYLLIRMLWWFSFNYIDQ